MRILVCVTGSALLAAAGVSDREAEVFALLGERLTHAQIGARLFISVRTVESHVASLRRKLGVADHAALVRLAAEKHRRPANVALPVPLTPFVGRARELAELGAAIGDSRLVSAVGPGGVGKTRLAIAAAGAVADRFGDGARYVDLVPVTDPAQVPTAVATALGTGEISGRSTEEALVATLGEAELLLVLDNCEHVVDAAARLAELLLSRCPRLCILVTSRTRLVVAFERVYQVPGLSLDADGAGDAVTLFLTRAESAGSPAGAADAVRVARVCCAVDGSALAIELAAARLPSLGLDGLERGLANHLELLAGGGRMHARHRSLRDMLDWSYQLLDPVEGAVLRRSSVFAAPFDADAAVDIAADDAVTPAAVSAALARLAEHSLLTVIPSPAGTRFRMLETVRQYGAALLHAAADPAHARHLDWCLNTAARLDQAMASSDPAWTGAFDLVTADLRAALGWAAGQTGRRADAHRLARLLAGLLFNRGHPSEAQRRYQQAADLADDPTHTAEALEAAAAAAKCRVVGPDALRLDRAAADTHLQAGHPAEAARVIARMAELPIRFRGMFAESPTDAEIDALIAEARDLAAEDPRADAAILIAEANRRDPRDPDTTEVAARAVELARHTGDPLLESAALDLSSYLHMIRGAIVEDTAIVRERLKRVSATPHDPRIAFELKDALHGCVMTFTGAGDLPAARRFAEQQLALPYLREERHYGVEDVLFPEALAGNFARVLTLSAELRDGWQRAGRPIAPGRGIPPAAVAMVHGILGDDTGRDEWLAILAGIRGVPAAEATRGTGYGETFDAIMHLHHRQPDQAFDTLANAETHNRFYGPLFRQWIVALRAEAAVLAGRPDATTHLQRAAASVTGNPIATTLLHRAQALPAADPAALAAVAAAFATAGCPYQQQRTQTLASPGNTRTP
jgi:predicted ATPase/DNA-binding CsgD family transcriptional regulator